MTDHQRGDTVLGEHPCVTPNLERFLADGLALTQTYCPSPHCCPSRATFMSGLYPSRHGVWNNVLNDRALSRGLAPGVTLWSEQLAGQGYRLAYAGKWHVSAEESPADRGWEELLVSSHKAQFHGQRWEDFRRLAGTPEPTERGEGQILRPGYGTYTVYGSTGEKGIRHDEKAVQEAAKALPELARSDRPWVLYVGCNAPHDPYFVPQKYLDRYDPADVPLPASWEDALAGKPGIYRRMRDKAWGQLSRREMRQAVRHYWALCTYLDALFGRVLSALEATGQAQNTLVLYCADHGDYAGDHGLFTKGIPCFRGAYHVPAVVRWPAGLAHPGRRVDAFVSLADFAPTFVELAGGQAEPDLTGRSLVPFLHGRTPADWRDEIHTQCNGLELYYTQRSVMTRDYKYVFNGFDRDELYDLRRDPDEMTNLADDPAREDVLRDMCRRMWRFAVEQQDASAISYITVSLAPYGPAEAFQAK